MSLTSSYTNAEDYFKAAVDFLCSYSWIYLEVNTSCLRSIDSMPQDFKDYFLEISKENLDVFPLIHEELHISIPSLEEFRKKLASLTPASVALEAIRPTPRPKVNHQRKMSPKKLHEIQQLATHINSHCQDTQLLVDLGSGLGYLTEALYELKPSLMILGLEADESRVQAARKRCKELLPAAASKSISYQSSYVSAKSRAYIEDCSMELARSNGCLSLSKMSIIGLHACADLSIVGMQLFLSMPLVQSIHIMPCCYHKLALRNLNDDSVFENFPLSAVLSKVVAAQSKPVHFNRPFLRLACQQTSARWRYNRSPGDGYHMFARALAEAICDVGESIKCKKPPTPISNQGQITFSDLQRRYQLTSKVTGQNLEWLPSHESKFMEMTENYSNNKGPCLAEALTCLQTSIQKLCENVVLFDRLCYLEEEAAARNLPVRTKYEQLVDEKLSPRCHVLIAEKLS
ncbi:uncharacterized protein Dwil_GK10627 [Drosophila willistoni]|uniref:Methyltransferase domain-containing protein n=2 Tax=Drosophila willistoni TaxID=7260 RepID=B4MIZ7_DROWI|nr:methyltransferase-like protein 25B isoform X2 [Drosophila willistoni]EDW72086.2 uncharacterized protein Dwil_GK10627 [Drosophila willistoni]